MADEAQAPAAVPPGVTPPAGDAAKPPPPKKPGLFAPKPKQGVDLAKSVSDLAGEINNMGRRLMVLEERYTNLRKKTQVTGSEVLLSRRSKSKFTSFQCSAGIVSGMNSWLVEQV